jgi:cellulose synthase/poly-beta-1,6-N-acetylglucosamine synthase-like glycosyltransferase
MDYIHILIGIFIIIWAVFFIMLFHYFFFAAVGLFARKKFPVTEEKLKYGIIIGARNEEAVIAQLIDSIHENDYPQEKLKIFVVAHNCTDNTARIAREHGAIVYEYDNPAERTVGFAYRFLVPKIQQDHGVENFDGFFIINADNVLSRDYISRMNDAFVANGREKVITSYRNSKNFGTNYMSCLYGMFFIAACRFEARGRTLFGCSTRVSGTGYVFNSKILKNGWEYVTLTEDWEFTADRIAEGDKIYYCDEAEFFDEQPTTVKVMLRQRLRWARGHTIVFFTRFKKLMGSLFRARKKGGKNKGSVYDISVSILPLGAIGICLSILQTIGIALSPLFGADAATVWAWYGIFWGASFAGSYALTVLSAVVLLVVERKHIPKLRFGSLLGALLLWPFFLGLNVFLDCISLFVKNLEWKVIPHTGDRTK